MSPRVMVHSGYGAALSGLADWVAFMRCSASMPAALVLPLGAILKRNPAVAA